MGKKLKYFHPSFFYNTIKQTHIMYVIFSEKFSPSQIINRVKLKNNILVQCCVDL